MATVRYDGPTRRNDPTTEFWVDGVRLAQDTPTEVPDELAQELLGGESDRLKGHKFSAVEDDDPAPRATDNAGVGAADENLGGGSAGKGGSPTARATART